MKASLVAGNAPCYQCSDRHLKCHADCQRFADWKEKVKAIEHERQQANIMYQYYHEKIVERERKICKGSKGYHKIKFKR